MLGVTVVAALQIWRSADLLLRGEADTLLEDARHILREANDPSPANLREIVERGAKKGLQYIAAVRVDGEVLAESGSRPEEWDPGLRLRGGESLRHGAVAWARSRPLPETFGHLSAMNDDAGRGRRPPPHAVTLLICFEPRLVRQVDRAATVAVVAGLLGALGLFALSLLARRFLRDRDEALTRLEKERRLGSMGTMSGVVAHELRNPLAALKGHAQLLVEALAQQPQAKLQAERVVDAAWRLERLSASLLELARTGAISRSEVSPAELVRNAVSELDTGRIHIDDAPAPPRWSVDPVRFAQVVRNLVENALQAAATEVEVHLGLENSRLIVEVRDHGPGVPASERERIFEPFVTTRTKGVGLGLAIARQVVLLHGGSLAVFDADGGGARFRAEIPSSAGGGPRE
jgi:two-component system sensor histidine kinase HydH